MEDLCVLAVTSCAMLLVGTGAAGLCQDMTFKELQLCIMFLSNFLIIWISLTEAISDLHHMLCE